MGIGEESIGRGGDRVIGGKGSGDWGVRDAGCGRFRCERARRAFLFCLFLFILSVSFDSPLNMRNGKKEPPNEDVMTFGELKLQREA